MLRPLAPTYPRLFVGALSVLCLLAAADPGPALADRESPESSETIQTPSGLRVRLDGAGGLELFLAEGSADETAVGRIDLLFAGGLDGRPQSQGEHELTVRRGASPLNAGPALAARLSSATPSGVRVLATRADLSPLGLDGMGLDTVAYHWPYFHVDDSLFWDGWLESDAAWTGAAVCRIESSNSIDMIELEVELHRSTRGADNIELRLPHWVVEGRDGRRVHLGLLRLDGRGGELLPDGSGVIWDASPYRDGTRPEQDPGTGSTVGIGWPLAVVTAPSLGALRHNLGQAWLTYRGPRVAAYEDRGRTTGDTDSSLKFDESNPLWNPPLLCARCRGAYPLDLVLRAELNQRQGIELIVNLGGVEGHGRLDGESLVLGGVVMGRWLVEADAGRALYRIPSESPERGRLLSAIEGKVPSGDLAFESGVAIDLAGARIELGPGVAGDRPGIETAGELPRFLSPRLLESWPNPFRDQTTIRYRVPATLGEAFDFTDRDLPSSVNLAQPPPFGDQPRVRIRVYNVSGKLVQVLHEAPLGPGEYHISWDGNDLHGRPVAAGAYYVSVEMGEYKVTRRVLRLHS